MKTLLFKTRIVAIALVAVIAVAFTSPALASDGKNPLPVELRYLGEYKSQPVFELTFNNTEDNEFIVVIRDEQSNVIYKDVIRTGTTSKKYILNTEEVGEDVALQFEITGKKTDKTVVFKVNKNTRYVQDVVVNKIK